jgi:hypothetical protein
VPATNRVQALDQGLVALDPPQCQVPVAGRSGESGSPIHRPNSKDDTGLTGLVPIVRPMRDTVSTAHEFFERYAAALLARDERAIAGMYAVPSLILFPGTSIAVSDASQTEEFFASAWKQYDGVDAVDKQITIMGEAPGSIWADVTWIYNGKAQERFCYQLIGGRDGYKIAVLTPMDLP